MAFTLQPANKIPLLIDYLLANRNVNPWLTAVILAIALAVGNNVFALVTFSWMELLGFSVITNYFVFSFLKCSED